MFRFLLRQVISSRFLHKCHKSHHFVEVFDARWWRGNIPLQICRWEGGAGYMSRTIYDRRSWMWMDLKRFFGENFRFQSLADFRCPAPRCSKRTRELNEMFAVKLLTKTRRLVAGDCNSEMDTTSWGHHGGHQIRCNRLLRCSFCWKVIVPAQIFV